MKAKAKTECECTNVKAATLETFDFSSFVGFPVMLMKVQGVRCVECGRETITDGKLISFMMRQLALDFCRLPRRLNAVEARYLRRRISVTQEELGARMGIARETVAKWETGTIEISPQHDFILRVLSLTVLIAESRFSRQMAEAVMAELKAVRSEPPIEAVPLTMQAPPQERRRAAV